MTETASVVEVTGATFETEVIAASHQIPVLVDFWAAWCQPCQVLMPLLDRIVRDYPGSARLAKVDTDRESALAAQFGIRSLPTVIVFRHGKVIQNLVGVQPESAYRSVIESLKPSSGDNIIESVDSLIRSGQLEEALGHVEVALEGEPDNQRLAMTRADLLARLGRVDEANAAVEALPADIRVGDTARRIAARCQLLALGSNELTAAESLKAKLAANATDHAARAALIGALVHHDQLEEALDQALQLLKRAPGYAEGAGRKALVNLFELLGSDHPLTTQYRRKMTAMLM